MNDIQCKNSSDDTEYATDWECIGNNSHKYTGTFDGQDYTITGLSTPTDNSSNYVGLFGYIDGGSVSHLILDGATIKGYRYVSGIAGNIKNATLTNCFVVNSSITTTYTGGGQRGVIAGDYQGSTSNCSDNYYLNCTVNGSNNNIGAYNNDRAWASRVLAITLPDNVTATGKSITYDGTTYYSTLNSNTITLHYEGTVPDGQVAVFTVTSSYKSKVETTYTSDTFQMKTNIVDCTVSMAFIEAYILTLESGIVATGMKTTIDGNEYYPSGYPVTLSCPDFAVGCTIVYSVNGTPIEGDTFEMPAQDVTVTATITDLWGLAEGANGSEANPYVITTPEGLQLLSTYVEEENDANGMYFQLGADIDMSGVTDFIPIGWSSSFSGTFDGAGHTISHLTIDMGDSDDIGLFGQNNGSTIRNLTLDGATITGSNQVGGIAGGGNDSSITNCHVISSVIRGDSSVGAIVGFLFEGNDLVGNTYHSTLVYGGTDNGFHDGGDAFNIGVGFYFDDNWDFYDGDVEDCFELDATKLFLGDSCDNSDLIAAYADPDNHTYNYADAPDLSNLEVTLQGRTLWKDGGWNTLCLPFDVDPFANTPLEGATVKTLSSSSFAGGTLTLNFTDATSIEAGKPYIVKWADGTNIVNPVFTNLTVTNALTDIETDIVDFVGTYDQISFGWEENRSVLLMGGNSKLFYPDGQGQTWLNACRGYFRLHEGYVAGDPNDPSSGIKFVLNFDGDATGIENTEGVKETDDVWYDLSGRKIEGRPTVPGVYIHDGRKVLIK